MVSMSRALADFLGVDDPLFLMKLEKLEHASGNLGVDVRLLAEMIGRSHQKMRELGLDPRDTTGQELYRALLNLVAKHDEFLARKLGVKDAADVQEILPRMKSFVEQLDIPKSSWAIKSSSAKRLIRSLPPKKVMKQLGYRSLDSMLKRESAIELFAAARFLEGPTWQSAMIKKYKSLTPRDFENRDVQLLLLDEAKWGTPAEAFVRTNRYNITHLKEFASVIVLPLPIKRMSGATITMLPLLIHYINEVRMYGAYFKTQQVKPDFGSILVNTIEEDEAQHATMAGHALHWRTIHRHFSRTEAKGFKSVFEPHVREEDLHWRKAEEVLYRIEPALHFWYDMDFIAMKTGTQIVSFNLIDMAVSYVNGLRYGTHSVARMRDSLWNELLLRYMGQQALEGQILRQLSSGEEAGSFSMMSLGEVFV